MTFGDYQFTCAICRQDIHDWSGRNGRDRHLKPLCRGCESVVSYGPYNQVRARNRVASGAFMDRRKAQQVHALADALSSEALRKQWRQKNARA